MKKILLTGAAGFIGFHTAKRLLCDGNYIIGIDNLNDYYDVDLKVERLESLKSHRNFNFIKTDINDSKEIQKIFETENVDIVLHLAAQAGVRYSLENPKAYIETNLNGFFNLMDFSVKAKIKHFIFASSSSVYGLNYKTPFSEKDNTDFPISLYAATKKSNELMAFSYSNLYDIPMTGLRFFTVYGPYGRPDMAYFKFTKAIFNGEEIEVYNDGNLQRDFTFIDDVVEGVVASVNSIAVNLKSNITRARPKFRIYNLGNNKPEKLLDFISIIEKECNKKAKIKFTEMQKADVLETFADISLASKELGYKPKTSLQDGLQKFIKWYANSKFR